MTQDCFPTISLTSQQLAAIKDFEIGKKYVLEITVQVQGLRKAEKYDLPVQDAAEGQVQNNSVLVATLDLKDVQAVDGNPVEDDEEDEDMKNDPSTYEHDYAQKMDEARGITININK